MIGQYRCKCFTLNIKHARSSMDYVQNSSLPATPRRRTFVPLLYLLLVLAGCATNQPLADGSQKVPARDELIGNEKPPGGLGAYGYILLLERPDDSNAEVYLDLCRNLYKNIESREKLETVDSGARFMVTYWLLTGEISIVDEAQPELDCEKRVELYNYPLAARIFSVISDKNLNASKLDGPFLVAWKKPWDESGHGDDILVFDVANVPLTHLDELIDVWRRAILLNSDVWGGVRIKTTKAKFWIAKVLEEYDSDIEKAIKDAFKILKLS